MVDQTREGKYLLSITGLNYVSVAGILAELGSFSSYQNEKQLIKVAGSNPAESESGGKRHSYTPINKQGRPALRHCVWTAVVPMLHFNYQNLLEHRLRRTRHQVGRERRADLWELIRVNPSTKHGALPSWPNPYEVWWVLFLRR